MTKKQKNAKKIKKKKGMKNYYLYGMLNVGWELKKQNKWKEIIKNLKKREKLRRKMKKDNIS